MKITATFFLILSIGLQAKTTVHFLPEANVQELAVKTIMSAEKEIYVSIYSFSSRQIKKALISQAKKGLDVKILVNNWKSEKVKNFVRSIDEAGAHIRGTPKINHHKFILTDVSQRNSVLFNSSANFSSSSMAAKYDENILICDDCANKIKAFNSEFQSTFKFSNKVIGANDAVETSAKEKENPVGENFEEALFTTTNMNPSYRAGRITYLKNSRSLVHGLGSVGRKLVGAIDNAKTSLQIATGHFRSKPLYDAVLNAKKRGLKVEIVLDGQEYISRTKQAAENSKIRLCMTTKSEAKCHQKGIHFGRLLSKIIPVKFKYYSIRWNHSTAQQMHSKYMILDGKVLYTGSYNWSNNAEFNSLENVAIYKDKNVIAAFKKNFKLVSNYGGAKGLKNLLSQYKIAKKKIRVVFNPLSLTIRQIDQLKSAARKKCPSLYKGPKGSYFCKF